MVNDNKNNVQSKNVAILELCGSNENLDNADVLIAQAHRLRTQSIALHRYFLNRKSNVHNGITLADAIETSVANVI
jgi:hypothetical protein